MKAAVLYSGGKDSSYALAHAIEHYEVEAVVTVEAPTASYMYHVPAVEVARTAAEKAGHDVLAVEVDGDDEITPLERTLAELDADVVVSGAVASDYQRERVDGVADRLGMEHDAPLWHVDPRQKLREVAGDYEVMVTAVAADGLDRDWLGRRLTDEAVDELLALETTHGVHPMGEGGEYESLALSGPHLPFEIDVEFERRWDGVRGEVEVTQYEIPATTT
ncbi:MAG: diphthine--ammonia ligase [Halobacteriota archaeon]